MIRQARQYLVGAMSGATLIAIAIAVFVVLVSSQVFGDWPIAGLVGGGDKPAVSNAQEAAATTGGGAEGAAGNGGAANTTAGGKAGGTQGGGGSGAAGLTGSEGGGQTGGSGGGGGGAENGGEGGSGGGSAPAQSPGGSGGSGASGSDTNSGSGGGGNGGGGEPAPKPTTSSPSSQVTGTVNETVHQVDETVTGGTLEETGGTQVTEEVVEGVAGPESTVGKTVDETTKTVEGVLGK